MLKKLNWIITILTLPLLCKISTAQGLNAQGLQKVSDPQFTFFYPEGFNLENSSKKYPIVYLYGKERQSINLAKYDYLRGKELTQNICEDLGKEFNKSSLRKQLNATAAKNLNYVDNTNSKSCYYQYSFPSRGYNVNLEYKIYQGTPTQNYAITIVYPNDSPYQDVLKRALHAFSLK